MFRLVLIGLLALATLFNVIVGNVFAQDGYQASGRYVNQDGPDVYLFEDNYVRCYIMKTNAQCFEKRP